jgi:hypothetical protein
MTTQEKVTQAAKGTGYGLIALAGCGVFVAMLYLLYTENFSGEAPQNMYSKVAEKYKHEGIAIAFLGDGIMVWGREHYNRAARRKAVYHVIEIDGTSYLRMTFLMAGSAGKASCYVEFRENPQKGFFQPKWVVNFSMLKMEDGSKRTRILEDNRSMFNQDTVGILESSF